MLPLLKAPDFDDLIHHVQGCRLCPEMAGCTRVLSWANGSCDADIMFIGEAPGRLGADRTAIPFHGDKAGDNFERLLDLAGLSRREVFVTNAVLCNPRNAEGNNSPPGKAALRNCAANLKQQLDIIQPKIVVTLGAAALEATRMIASHGLILSSNVRSANAWYGRIIIPLYHPGARAMIHRNYTAQTADYYFVGETFRRLGRQQQRRTPRSPAQRRRGWDLTAYLLSILRESSLFRLHKILYLTEIASLAAAGKRATDFVYIRQKEGPYCVELGSRWFHRFEDTLAVQKQGSVIHLTWAAPTLFASVPSLDEQVRHHADQVIKSARTLTDSQLKTKAYLTEPMKSALRAERSGLAALNKPLL